MRTAETAPTSTVALARWSDNVVETYVLGDSFVVTLRTDGAETVHTDDRLDAVGAPERAAYRTRLAAGYGYDVATDPDGSRWPRSKRHDDKTLVVVDPG